MKNPFNNWFTPDEQRVLIFIIFAGFLGFILKYTGLIAQEKEEKTDSLKIVLQKDYEIKYDLKIVTKKELMSIPGIGVKKASDILKYREDIGFNNKKDLLNIKGIGEKSYQKIEKYFIDTDERIKIAVDQENVTLKEDKAKIISTSKSEDKNVQKSLQKIDINTADESQFLTLKGIGPAKAKKIIALREELGEFTSIDQIMQVKGIGEKTFAKFKDQIFIGERKK